MLMYVCTHIVSHLHLYPCVCFVCKHVILMQPRIVATQAHTAHCWEWIHSHKHSFFSKLKMLIRTYAFHKCVATSKHVPMYTWIISLLWDSNPRPPAYWAGALPTKLKRPCCPKTGCCPMSTWAVFDDEATLSDHASMILHVQKASNHSTNDVATQKAIKLVSCRMKTLSHKFCFHPL